MTPAPSQDLTARQLDVARLLAEGYGRREVADALGLAHGTVQAHIQAINRRLGGDGSVRRRVVAYLRGREHEGT